MPSRRTLALPLVALLTAFTLFAGACSSDDKADDTKKSTTTEKDGKSSDSETTTTMSDADFSAGIKKIQTGLKDAGDDPCKVIEAFQSVGSAMGAPSNTDQRRQVTELAVEFYNKVADVAPKDLATQAETLRKVADKIEQEGKEANWSEEFMKSPKSIENDKAFEEASMTIMTSISQSCGGPAGTDKGTGGAEAGGATETPPTTAAP